MSESVDVSQIKGDALAEIMQELSHKRHTGRGECRHGGVSEVSTGSSQDEDGNGSEGAFMDEGGESGSPFSANDFSAGSSDNTCEEFSDSSGGSGSEGMMDSDTQSLRHRRILRAGSAVKPPPGLEVPISTCSPASMPMKVALPSMHADAKLAKNCLGQAKLAEPSAAVPDGSEAARAAQASAVALLEQLLQSLPASEQQLQQPSNNDAVRVASEAILQVLVSKCGDESNATKTLPAEASMQLSMPSLATMPCVPTMPMPGMAALQAPEVRRTQLRSSARPFQSQGACMAGPFAGSFLNEMSPDLRASGLQPQVSQNGETMRMHLQELAKKDHHRVLIVRRIQRLGYDSPATLKTYFEWYGSVETVLVSHSHVRSLRKGPVTRLRPAHIGFVIMDSIEGADAALKDGESHVVVGSPIEVHKFVPLHGEACVEERTAEQEVEEQAHSRDSKDSSPGVAE